MISLKNLVHLIQRFKLGLNVLILFLRTKSMRGGNAVNFCGDGMVTTRPLGKFNKDFVARFNESLRVGVPSKFHGRYDHTIWRSHYYSAFGEMCTELEGDFIEFGVWYGFNALILGKSERFQRSDKTFHLVDAFGFDKFGSESNCVGAGSIGKYGKDITEVVESRFAGVSHQIHQGLIPDILNSQDLPVKVSFVSIDLNDAKAEAEACEFIWPRLVVGGAMYIDDYGCQGYERTMKFYDQFVSMHNAVLIKTPFAPAIVIKVSE